MNSVSSIDELIEYMVHGLPTIELERLCASLKLDDPGLQGRTPLMVASAEGLLPEAKTLVACGASVHAIGDRRMTALHEASARGQLKLISFLLSHGADVNAATINGITPLMCAAAWGNTEVAEHLLAKGANSAASDANHLTAADIAREKGEDTTADVIEQLEHRKTSG